MAKSKLEKVSGQSGNCFVRLAPDSEGRKLDDLLEYSKLKPTHFGKRILVIDAPSAPENWQGVIRQSSVDEVVGWGIWGDQKVDLPFQALPDARAARHYFSSKAYSNTLFLVFTTSECTYTDILGYAGAALHQAELRVNLDAIRHNLKVHRSVLRAGASVAVMVKANAYGTGLVETSRALERAGVEYLAVAYADEGVQLRRAGIQCPVMVLNTETNAFEHFLQWQLEPVVYSFEVLEKLTRFLENQNSSLAAHLEFNTGMNRLGFEPEEAPGVGKYLSGHLAVRVSSAFAHLAASGAVAHDAFSERQVQRFLDAHAELERGLGAAVPRHILNSGGVARFPQYDMDMVRLGIGIYGADETGALQPRLEVVSSLQACVSQVRTLKAGETVGYSRAGQLPEGARVATLGIGYADGVPRALGNGRHQVLINGQLAPTTGNICMDMCMIDVSKVKGVEAGSIATFFGDIPTVQDVAKQLHTIPYEVFTSVGQRVRRVYTETL